MDFITIQIEYGFRIPYERSSKNIPRICILIGILNERTLLNDHTEERRDLPVLNVTRIKKKSIYIDNDYQRKLFGEECLESFREDFNQALAYKYCLCKNNLHSWTIPKDLLKDLYKEQEKFKYLYLYVEDIRYFLEGYKPRSQEPNITCLKELIMQGYGIKSKVFSEILDIIFQNGRRFKVPK